MGGHRAILIAWITLIVFISVARAAQQTVNWAGGNGSWTDPTKWSTGTVPNNGGGTTYAVNIDNGKPAASSVALFANSTSTFSVDSLAIDAGDRLNVGPNINLQVTGSFPSLSGFLSVTGGASPNSARVILPPNETLAGSGTLGLGDYANVAAASGSLTLDGDLTLAGAQPFYLNEVPSIGSDGVQLINRRPITVSGFSGLVFAGSSIDNQGSFEVTNNGTIGFRTNGTLPSLGTLINHGGMFAICGTLQNTGQTFRVDNTSGQWALNGTIHSGTIETGDGMALQVPFLTQATLDQCALNGKMSLIGRLIIPTGQSLSGNGEIVISGLEAPEGIGEIYSPLGATIIGQGMFVHGGCDKGFIANFLPRGSVGSSFYGDLINNGTIAVDPLSPFGGSEVLHIEGETIVNRGTFKVAGSSTLDAWGDCRIESGGKLLVDGGGMLKLLGDLDLSSTDDFLDVLPRPGAMPYDNYLIVACFGVQGNFSHVTAGITVDYSTPGEIHISGTPVPEAASIVLLGFTTLLWTVRRCR